MRRDLLRRILVEAEVSAMDQFLTQDGRSNTTKGFDPESVDSDELAMGIEVEKEHTTEETVSRKISLDHLSEFPNYYTGLKKMEELLKAGVDPEEWGSV